MRIGIIGAGFIGRAVARLAVKHGYDVMISNSRNPKTLASTVASIGCRTGSSAEAAAFSDVILLAVPFHAIRDIPPGMLDGKIVMDANNYYPERDGRFPELDDRSTSTSEMVAAHFKGATIVKAFNAILERDIEPTSRPQGSPERRAIPICGDDEGAKTTVADLINVLGFDVVDAGPLSEGWRFERARPAYCASLSESDLKIALRNADEMVAEGSWRQR